jgi:abortive infection alpha-like protein
MGDNEENGLPIPGRTLDRALGPAADEFGKAVAPLGQRAGKLTEYVGGKLLGMLEHSVYGIASVAEWVRAEVSMRLQNVPEDKIAAPNPRIAVPAVQALTYSMGEEHIREMFANLLAADMNADFKENAHPAFVEIIKEMMPVDARLIKLFRKAPQIQYRARIGSQSKFNELGIEYSFDPENIPPTQIATSLSNLERLGLVRIAPNEFPIRDDLDGGETRVKAKYELATQQMSQIREQLEKNAEANAAILKALPSGTVFVSMNGIYLTPLGVIFARVCL